MTGNVGRAPEDWRNYSDKTPLAAIVLRKGDLKKLYKIINDKQIAFRDKTMSFLAQQKQSKISTQERQESTIHTSFL
jgi:hypothetical protein